MDLGILVDQFSRHEGDISGRRHMGRRIGQAAAVLKMGVGHAKSGRPLVHHFHKFFLCSCYVFRHGHGSVVS